MEVIEHDDYGFDEDEYHAVQPPTKKRGLYCEHKECGSKQPLHLDREAGYYVCTECGTIANAAVFDNEVLQEEGYNALKWQTFLKINGFKAPPLYGTDVPSSLFATQLSAARKFTSATETRRQRISRAVRDLLTALRLPEGYQTPVEHMVACYVDQLEAQRKDQRKTRLEQAAQVTYAQVLAERTAETKSPVQRCADCKKSTDEWKRRSVCCCVQCAACCTKEDAEAELQELEATASAAFEAKKETELTFQDLREAEKRKERKHWKHKCRALPSSEWEHKRRQAKKQTLGESRTVVNAFNSIATACVCLFARLRLKRLRWKELTAAAGVAFGWPMKRNTLTRWTGKISRALDIQPSSNYEAVLGYANHYLDKLCCTSAKDRISICYLIGGIMSRTEPVHRYEDKSLRAVTGRVYTLLLNEQLADAVHKYSATATNLHHRQPWVLAAVCVYLELHVGRECKITIAKLCTRLGVDPTMFQQCKSALTAFI